MRCGEGQNARRLYTVAIIKYIVFFADVADLPDGLDYARFVIGRHNRAKDCVLTQGVFHRLRADYAAVIGIDKRYLEAEFAHIRGAFR